MVMTFMGPEMHVNLEFVIEIITNRRLVAFIKIAIFERHMVCFVFDLL